MMAMGSAIASPLRRSFSEAVANVSLTSTLPPTRISGASRSWARSSTLLRDRELGFLVEIAGERDHDERGPPVGGPQRIRSGRPGVGHVEHALERGDRCQAGREVPLDLGVADVDVVGHDCDLPTGLGEVVEPLGHATRLGGGAGAEVGRQHRERGAADGRGHDQQHEPREDDGAPAAHHETPEPAHHAATRSLVLPTRATGRLGVAVADRVQDAGERADRQGAGSAEDCVMAVGVDDHLRGDQPADGPERRGCDGPQDAVEPAHRNRQRLGQADGGAADCAHRHQAGGVGAIVDDGGAGSQAHRQTGRGGADPADPPIALDAADAGLHRAEHGTTGETADHGGACRVDAADRGSSRHAGEREPDEGPEPPKPPGERRSVLGHVCLPLGFVRASCPLAQS